MTFEWNAPDAAATNAAVRQRVRAEQLILDRRAQRPLPLTGLVFTGSFREALANQPGRLAVCRRFH